MLQRVCPNQAPCAEGAQKVHRRCGGGANLEKITHKHEYTPDVKEAQILLREEYVCSRIRVPLKSEKIPLDMLHFVFLCYLKNLPLDAPSGKCFRFQRNTNFTAGRICM